MTWLSRVAGAPVSWGVTEVPGWGHQLPARRLVAELREIGLRATELGPRGYFSQDPEAMAALAAPPPVQVVGGFVAAVLHRAGERPGALATVRKAAARVAAAGGSCLSLAAATGDPGYEHGVTLDENEWRTLVGTWSEAQGAVAGQGVPLLVHPHYGTAIQSTADVDRLLTDTDAPLCLDTGHLILGGVDPLALARKAAARVRHVHLKDVDADLAAQVRSGAIGYRAAVAAGLFLPLGAGTAPIREVIATLEAQGYRGWYVLEQDIALSHDPPPGAGPMEDVRRSLEFLRADQRAVGVRKE